MNIEEKLCHLQNWLALQIDQRVSNMKQSEFIFEMLFDFGVLMPKQFYPAVPSFEGYLKQVVPNTENWKFINNYNQ